METKAELVERFKKEITKEWNHLNDAGYNDLESFFDNMVGLQSDYEHDLEATQENA